MLARPVAVELDAIPVGVAKVERLADAVVRRTLQLNAGALEPAQGVPEQGAGRIEDRHVIKSGRAGRRRTAAEALPRVEPEMVVVAAGRDERRLRPETLREFEPEDAAIEIERALQIRDLQMDVSAREPPSKAAATPARRGARGSPNLKIITGLPRRAGAAAEREALLMRQGRIP